MSQGLAASAERRASDIKVLEQRVIELSEEVQRRSMRFTLMQAESKLLRNVHGRLDASHSNTMDRVSDLESQLQKLRNERTARDTERQSCISDLLAGEDHEDWCEIGRSQHLADLAKEAQWAEQRMTRTQLWARDQLRRMAAAQAESLDAFSQSCKTSFEHAERTIGIMRKSLDEARRRLAESRRQLQELRAQGAS